MCLIEDAILLKGALLGNNHKQWLGLFPGRSRLQFLIDCSMQEWEGLEEGITCMISGRHEVVSCLPHACLLVRVGSGDETRHENRREGVVPDEES